MHDDFRGKRRRGGSYLGCVADGGGTAWSRKMRRTGGVGERAMRDGDED
jgi:hypothetical protein